MFVVSLYGFSRNILTSYAREGFEKCFVKILPRYWITWLSPWANHFIIINAIIIIINIIIIIINAIIINASINVITRL